MIKFLNRCLVCNEPIPTTGVGSALRYCSQECEDNANNLYEEMIDDNDFFTSNIENIDWEGEEE